MLEGTRSTYRMWLAAGVVLAIIGCGRGERGDAPSKYLYVWAGDADRRPGDSDFLAVIDVDSASPTYAQVVATTPIGAVHTMPHHSELTVPPVGQPLFANAFMANRTYLFDLSDPRAPRIKSTIDSVPGFRMPHSYMRLDDGNVLATLQFGDGSKPGNPGGLGLFSPDGALLKTVSAADSAFPGERIRTYSLDVSKALDRFITTSTPMDSERTADVVQVWRLRDLSLIRTIPLPPSATDSSWRYPFEVRFLPDGNAFLNTWNCGFYLLTGLEGTSPAIEPVLALSHPRNIGCGVPALVTHYWIMPVGEARQYIVLDIADPRRPRIASVLAPDTAFVPHWTSLDPRSNRVALTSEGTDKRVLLARFDSTNGLLTWDEGFKEAGATVRGVSFNREKWPHGDTGPAVPHAAVFGPGRRR